jgi:hypothetical protein
LGKYSNGPENGQVIQISPDSRCIERLAILGFGLGKL